MIRLDTQNTGGDLVATKYGITRPNKAHTATTNRIVQRYGGKAGAESGFDVVADGLIVEVETTATMLEANERLEQLKCAAYIAMTNKDGVKEALRATRGSRVGIMDPYGNVVRESANQPIV